jgi:hypothetical protein
VLANLRGLRRDPVDHDHEHEHCDSGDREQNDRRSSGAREPMRREPPHYRGRNRRHDRRRDDGPHDCLRRPQEPDHSREQEEESDEEPRRAAEITQPARRGEHGRELPRLDRAQLDRRRRLSCIYGAVPLEEMPEEARASHSRPMVPRSPGPQHHPEGVM